MYVTLDLQPGRANLLTQAKLYRSLLKLPNVGLALDPEWQLGPRQLPLHQIGSVGINEVNDVVNWLARLTAKYHLPQKLLELHEFRLTMIQDIQKLDTRHSDLAIVINMDGQGAPSDQAADVGCRGSSCAQGRLLRLEGLLRQGHADAGPAGDDRPRASASADLLPVDPVRERMPIKRMIWSAELDKLRPRLAGHQSGLGGGEPYGSGLSYPQAPGHPDRRVGELGLDVWLDPAPLASPGCPPSGRARCVRRWRSRRRT